MHYFFQCYAAATRYAVFRPALAPRPRTRAARVSLAHAGRRTSCARRARLWEKTAGVVRDREQPRITIHIIQQ